MTIEYRCFLEWNFVVGKRLFVLIYSTEYDNAQRYTAKRCYLPKGIIKNYNVLITEMNFHDQPIYSDIKRYEQMTKSTTGQDED